MGYGKDHMKDFHMDKDKSDIREEKQADHKDTKLRGGKPDTKVKDTKLRGGKPRALTVEVAGDEDIYGEAVFDEDMEMVEEDVEMVDESLNIYGEAVFDEDMEMVDESLSESLPLLESLTENSGMSREGAMTALQSYADMLDEMEEMQGMEE